jgi:hypothetical protein
VVIEWNALFAGCEKDAYDNCPSCYVYSEPEPRCGGSAKLDAASVIVLILVVLFIMALICMFPAGFPFAR